MATIKKRTLSPSSLGTFERCPRLYEYSYIKPYDYEKARQKSILV